jgi:phosphatidylethanolamine-binding protein (PEBP) family uncharacterized protein
VQRCNSLALIIVDIDKNFYHGIYYNINPNTKVIYTIDDFDFLNSNIQGKKYSPFCPPSGNKEHHYHFDFYYLTENVPKYIKNRKDLFSFIRKSKVEKVTKVKTFKCPLGKKCFYKK